MPRHCSAGGCKSRDNRETRKAGITFHKLPKGATRRNLWITNSHRSGLWDPQTDFVYFCSKHFTLESFELNGYSGIRRLREDAFPTVFDAIPETKRKGPGRPRKREDFHLRKKTQSVKGEVVVRESIQGETKGAENTDGDEVQNSTPKSTEKLGRPQDTSEAKIPPQQEERPPSPAAPCSQPPTRPLSPSHYMRRLPPPPGFYLPKEHSYAQLCPLLWRRRYERAVDCLEKALRQLNAARRRENRLRVAVSRLREKRHRPTEPRDSPKSKGSRGSLLVNREEGRVDAEAEEAEPFGYVGREHMEWAGHFHTADPNALSEEEGGCCFYCGRTREESVGRARRPVSRKNGKPVVRHGSSSSHAQGSPEERPQLIKQSGHRESSTAREADASRESNMNYHCSLDVMDGSDSVQLVVLEGPLGEGLEALNLHSTLRLPAHQPLPHPHQLTSDWASPHSAQVQYLQCSAASHQDSLLSDSGPVEVEPAGLDAPEELPQQVFFLQESTGGRLFLVPVSAQDGLKDGVWTEEEGKDVHSVLVSEVGLQTVLGQVTGEEQVPEPHSGGGAGGLTKDIREKLKEHLEGFHLQLSNEFIN